MDVLLSRPAVDKQADGEGERSRNGDYEWEAVFGGDCLSRGCAFDESSIAEVGNIKESNQGTQPACEEDETCRCGCEVVDLAEDKGVGCEEEVENTVEDCDVDAHYCDDGTEDEHF